MIEMTKPVCDDQAVRLAVAVSKLRGGLRDARWEVTDLSITQVSLLRYLDAHGSATAAELAVAEHISPQAVAQQLRVLKERGYVSTAIDPGDRRKTLISMTAAGRDLLDDVLKRRESWLARAIEAIVRPEERVDLERAIAVLERLADQVARPARGRDIDS